MIASYRYELSFFMGMSSFKSDYEEIFWVGIATIGLNAVYFGVKALYIIAKLLNVIWVYRPYRLVFAERGRFNRI